MWWNSRRSIQIPKGWCHQDFAFILPANGRPSSAHRTGKKSIFIPVPKKDSTKECANHWTTALISHASKVMPKILHARLQYYANQELPDVQAQFRKGRGTRDQIATFVGSQRKLENSRKTPTSVSLTTSNPLTVWIIINCGKLLKRWEYQTILPVS